VEIMPGSLQNQSERDGHQRGATEEGVLLLEIARAEGTKQTDIFVRKL